VDRAVDRVRSQKSEYRFEECCELGLGHLAAGHHKFAMANAAEAADVAVNGNVVRRIGKDEFSLRTGKELIVDSRVAGISAEQAMAIEQPQIAGLADRRTRRWIGALIFWPAPGPVGFARFLQDEVDLRHLKPG
jgi:hypothetical protein